MLRISDNHRFLVTDSGSPFFYLGDTAWELFHRLTREEADLYLKNRSVKRFTVIQAVVLAEFKGVYEPNAYGDLPCKNRDITRPDERYFRHVDYIVKKANRLGMYIGMLPSWGDKVGINGGGDGPENFINGKNARVYGRFLGRRYAKSDIIWILGGDRLPTYNEKLWRELASGIREGDRGRGLITYHPSGQYHSSWFFHNEDWLDFNMCQTGHTIQRDSYKDIAADYALTPVKPCLDGEPGYEDHPNGWNPANGYIDEFHVRTFAYWNVFAGACGHTYGCHDVWQFLSGKYPHVSTPRTFWKKAMDLPGAFQMAWLRNLVESRPYLTRIPDQNLVYPNWPYVSAHMQATRDGTPGTNDATYIMIYMPENKDVTVFTKVIVGKKLRQWWFNPRTGEAGKPVELKNSGKINVAPPTKLLQEDWVLVIDDAAKKYGAPGAPVKMAGA